MNYDHEFHVRQLDALWRVTVSAHGRRDPNTCRNFSSYVEALEYAQQQALKLAANDGDTAVVVQSAGESRVVWSSKLER